MLDRQRDEREASLPDAGPMRIALDGRRILLEQALAAWPRRGTTLVESTVAPDSCSSHCARTGLTSQAASLPIFCAGALPK